MCQLTGPWPSSIVRNWDTVSFWQCTWPSLVAFVQRCPLLFPWVFENVSTSSLSNFYPPTQSHPLKPWAEVKVQSDIHFPLFILYLLLGMTHSLYGSHRNGQRIYRVPSVLYTFSPNPALHLVFWRRWGKLTAYFFEPKLTKFWQKVVEISLKCMDLHALHEPFFFLLHQNAIPKQKITKTP